MANSATSPVAKAGEESPILFRYTLPFVTVAVATVFRLELDPFLGMRAVFIFFLLAILLTARYGGLGPGLIATVLGTLSGDYLFLKPRFNFGVYASTDLDRLVLFAVAGAAVSVFCGQLRIALARSVLEEDRFRLISNTVPQILWTAEPDGVRDFVNDRFYKYTGAEPGTGLGTAWTTFIHPDDMPRVARDWAKGIASGSECNYEFRIRRRDGAYRWFESRMVALRDARGRTTKWFGSSTDIQEARELREAARADAERFALVVATAPGAICHLVLRPGGSLAMPFASPAIREIYGLEPADVAEDASPILERIHPDDRKRFTETTYESAREMSVWRQEFRVLHPGKGELWIAGQAAPVSEPDGTVSWYGFLSDVTEKRRADLALRERTEQELHILQALVEKAPMSIAMLDRRMRIVQGSGRWLGDVGMKREQVIGKNLYECFPNLPEAWPEAHRRGLAGESLAGHEERFVTPDGNEHWVTWQIVPWGDAGETTGGIILTAEDVSERIRAEATARKREMEYRALFENMTEGLAYCRIIVEGGKPRDYVYLSVNEAFASLTGIRNLAGRRMSEVLDRNVEPEVLELFGRVALTGVPEKLEAYMDRYGQWFAISAYSPEPGYFVSISDVVTERKRAELAARQWQRAFEQSESGIVLANPVADTIEAMNSAGARMLGYQPEEVAGRPLADFYPEDERRRRAELLEKVDSDAGHATFESRLRRKDGSEFPALLEVAAVRDKSGVVVSRVGIIHDLSEKKHAEAALRDSEQTIRALLETAGQGIFAVNREARIVFLNHMAGNMFGYGVDELMGQPLTLLIPANVREGHGRHHASYFANSRVRPMGQKMALEALRRDGRRFPVEVNLSFIETAAGNLAVAFVSDITERRQLELAAQARAHEIDALAARLLMAQEEERRRVSRELHDGICQQLAYLAIETGKLAARPLPDGTQHQLMALQARAVQAAESARHIAHELHPSTLDDLGVVTSLESLCDEFSARYGIAVRFRHGAVSGSMPGETSSCLFRVVQQSLENIAQHSGARQVVVSLRLREGNLLLSVRDDGIGFVLEKIRGRGSLGLLGMEERARLANGKLSISTQPGRGTRIALEIPLPAGFV
jgi:PAS domain S-box-containing protein